MDESLRDEIIQWYKQNKKRVGNALPQSNSTKNTSSGTRKQLKRKASSQANDVAAPESIKKRELKRKRKA